MFLVIDFIGLVLVINFEWMEVNFKEVNVNYISYIGGVIDLL